MGSIYYAVKVLVLLWICMLFFIFAINGNKSDKADGFSKYFIMVTLSVVFPVIQYSGGAGKTGFRDILKQRNKQEFHILEKTACLIPDCGANFHPKHEDGIAFAAAREYQLPLMRMTGQYISLFWEPRKCTSLIY